MTETPPGHLVTPLPPSTALSFDSLGLVEGGERAPAQAPQIVLCSQMGSDDSSSHLGKPIV